MHPTKSDDPKRAARRLPRPASGKDRFDGDSARGILERAAAEQQRLDNELAGSYSFEELQQIAGEAGITPEALRAAVEAHATSEGSGGAGPSRVPDGGPRSRRPLAMIMPGRWSRALTGAVLATAGGLGIVGLIVAFPAVAQSALWALLAFLILVAVLVALGASPF